jgi:hypothetical protein
VETAGCSGVVAAGVDGVLSPQALNINMAKIATAMTKRRVLQFFMMPPLWENLRYAGSVIQN